MNNIIGYYSYWGEGMLDEQNISLEELKESSVSLKTASVSGSGELVEEDSEKEMFFQMIQNNKITIADYCNKTGIVRLMYEHPITVKAYTEALGFDRIIPIFEDQKEFLKLG